MTKVLTKDINKIFCVYISFNIDDLFSIGIEDDTGVTLGSMHLINKMNLPNATVVFNTFHDRYWITGNLSDDKIKWFKIINENF